MPDVDREDWVRGPLHGRGAVGTAYIAGTLDRDCPNCFAPQGDYCVHKGTDVQRRMPCPQRLPRNPEVDR